MSSSLLGKVVDGSITGIPYTETRCAGWFLKIYLECIDFWNGLV